MSIQSYQQRLTCKGNLWIDSGTNVSTMEKSFKMIEDSVRRVDMTGFANDPQKKNILIGSGLTRCIDKNNGFEFLLGLHEAPYLANNDSCLLSTN